MKAGYGVDDFATLHFVGDTLEKVVASQPNVGASWFEADGRGGVTERRLDTTYLGR